MAQLPPSLCAPLARRMNTLMLKVAFVCSLSTRLKLKAKRYSAPERALSRQRRALFNNGKYSQPAFDFQEI